MHSSARIPFHLLKYLRKAETLFLWKTVSDFQTCARVWNGAISPFWNVDINNFTAAEFFDCVCMVWEEDDNLQSSYPWWLHVKYELQKVGKWFILHPLIPTNFASLSNVYREWCKCCRFLYPLCVSMSDHMYYVPQKTWNRCPNRYIYYLKTGAFKLTNRFSVNSG